MRAKDFIKEEHKFSIDPMFKDYYDDEDNSHNRILVNINVELLDKLWSREKDFYIGKGGTNQIKNRYERFGDFISKHDKPIHTSTIDVSPDGRISFYNGRHRFAWLRDNGYKTIPIGMDRASAKNAKNIGLLSK